MAYTCLVDGVDKTTSLLLQGTEVSLESNRRATATLIFKNFRPGVGQPVGLTDEDGTTLFGGSIDEIEEDRFTDDYIAYRCTCVSYEARLDRRITYPTDGRIVFGGAVFTHQPSSSFFLPNHGLVEDQRVRFTTTDTLPTGLSTGTTYYVSELTADNFQIAATAGGSVILLTDAGTGTHRVQWLSKDIITSVIEDHADGDAITVGTECEDGEFVDAQIFDHISVSEAMDRLATLSGFVWYLTPDRKVVFQSRATDEAPFHITTSEADIRQFTYNETREDYHNTEFRRIAFEATDALAQNFGGDAATKHFFTNYPIARIDSLSVDGSPVTVGILGTSGFDAYYEPGNQGIIFDVAPGSSTSIDVVYRQLGSDIVFLDDLTAVGERSTAESNSGRYEIVADDTGLADAIGAIRRTQASVDAHKALNGVASYVTSRSGLRVGMYQTVTLSAFNLSAVDFVIDRIRCVPVNSGRMNYHVTMLTGPKLRDLVDVFRGTSGGAGSVVTGGSPTDTASATVGNVTIGTPSVSYFVEAGSLQRKVKIDIPFTGPASVAYRGCNVWTEIPQFDSASPDDPEGGALTDQGWHLGEPSTENTATLILPRPGRNETWRVYFASRSETRANPLVLSTEASPTPYVDVDVAVSAAVNVTSFSLTGSDPATYAEGGRAILIPFEFTLPAGASWEVVDWDHVDIEVRTASMGLSDEPGIVARFDRATGLPGDSVSSVAVITDLPTGSETWTFSAVSYSLTGQKYGSSPTDTVGVTAPSALAVTPPGPVTIVSASVSASAFADDATGEMRVRIIVPFVAPSPLNGFDGVEVYLEAPSETSTTSDPTGGIIYPQGWHYWDPGGAPQQNVELILPYPWRAEGWHIYLSSRRPEYQNPLVLSSGGSPTPYVLVSLSAPTPVQVANFALGTPTYPANTKSVVVPFSFDLPTASNWRTLDWDRMQVEVRTSSMAGTDKPVIAAVFDRDSGAPGDTIESAMTFTDLPESNESWTFEAVSYSRRNVRISSPPIDSATIGPPSALPLPANVTGFTATYNTLKGVDGTWQFQFEGSWTNPTDPYFVGVEVVAIWTGDTREIILAIQKEGATEFRTDYWPLQESDQEVTIKAYAINREGIRQTTGVPSVTFDVEPSATTPSLRLSRADTSTIGAGLTVSGGALLIPSNGVVTSMLAAQAVTTAKIAAAAITTAELANLAVDNSKLAALAVDAAKLANSAVTATKIANAAVGSAAIANAAIGTVHIANAAIVDAHVANLSVSKLLAGTMTLTGTLTFAGVGNFLISATGEAIIQSASGFSVGSASPYPFHVTTGGVVTAAELNSSGGLKVGGNLVVGSRGASIANTIPAPSSGSTGADHATGNLLIFLQDLAAIVDLILARMRASTGHGLISG